MNRGPLIFLGVFFALALSWYGLVLAPQLEIGGQQPDKLDLLAKLETRENWKLRQSGQPVKDDGSGPIYPSNPAGLARQGAEVYRANGCATCHTRQLRQTGVTFDVLLVKAGTNLTELLQAVRQVKPALDESGAQKLIAGIPQPVLERVSQTAADVAVKALGVGGAQAEIQLVPLGPDMARGWGQRRTVAQDYLYDNPVLLGAQRIGPDLVNVGQRLPSEEWHLLHLYNPRILVAGSLMPPYRFLFERRKIERQPSPDALKLTGPFAPPAGYEIVPTEKARTLVAYLLGQRIDTSLFEAPLPQTATAAPSVSTNAPATNAPAGNGASNSPAK